MIYNFIVLKKYAGFLAIQQHAGNLKKHDKVLLPFSFRIEMDFGQNGRRKRKNIKILYRNTLFDIQNLCFNPAKPMFSLPKNYVFATQNLCFFQQISDFFVHENFVFATIAY